MLDVDNSDITGLPLLMVTTCGGRLLRGGPVALDAKTVPTPMGASCAHPYDGVAPLVVAIAANM
jgi:hypothetical protein